MGKQCPECLEEYEQDDLFCCECSCPLVDLVEEEQEPVSTNEIVAPAVMPELPSLNQPMSLPSMQGFDDDSDCEHFKMELNIHSTIFRREWTSSFHLKITPINLEGHKASDFKIFIKDSDRKPVEHELSYVNIKKTRDIMINYKPQSNFSDKVHIGLYFHYSIDEKVYWYFVPFDIFVPSLDSSSQDIAKDITINIGDVSGGANDFSVLDKIKNANSNDNIFEALRNATPVWQVLILGDAKPLYSRPKSISTTCLNNMPNELLRSLTIELTDGFRVHIFTEEVLVGRNKTCDIITRNLPKTGEKWEHKKLLSHNQKISGEHCKFGVTDTEAWIGDISKLGTFLDSKAIGDDAKLLDPNSHSLLELAEYESYARNFKCNIQVFSNAGSTVGGICITRTDYIREAYILVNESVPLSLILDCSDSDLIIKRVESHLCLANREKEYWLSSNCALHSDFKVKKIITPVEQYL